MLYYRISLVAWNCDKLCMHATRARRPWKSSMGMCLPSVSTLDLVKFTWNCTRVLYEYYEYYDPDKIERHRIWSVNRTLNVSSPRGEGQLKSTKVWWTLTNSEVLDVRIKFSSILQYDVEFGRQRCAEKWTFVDVRLTFRSSRNQLDDSQLASAAAAATAAHTRRSACCCYGATITIGIIFVLLKLVLFVAPLNFLCLFTT